MLFRSAGALQISQQRNEELFNILDKFSTRLVRLYYLACWETDDKDGMVVSKNILNMRGYLSDDE